MDEARRPYNVGADASLEFGRISEHQFERFVREMLGLQRSSLGDTENDGSQLQATGLYGVRALADLRRDLRPSIIKGLPDGFKLLGIKRGIGDNLASFHFSPQARSRA